MTMLYRELLRRSILYIWDIPIHRKPPVEPAKLGVINETKYKILKVFTNIIRALSILLSQLLWSWVVSIFYFPQFRRLHWGLFKDYTYSVICFIKFVLTSIIELNLQVIKSWELKPIVILNNDIFVKIKHLYSCTYHIPDPQRGCVKINKVE